MNPLHPASLKGNVLHSDNIVWIPKELAMSTNQEVFFRFLHNYMHTFLSLFPFPSCVQPHVMTPQPRYLLYHHHRFTHAILLLSFNPQVSTPGALPGKESCMLNSHKLSQSEKPMSMGKPSSIDHAIHLGSQVNADVSGYIPHIVQPEVPMFYPCLGNKTVTSRSSTTHFPLLSYSPLRIFLTVS